MKPYPNSRDVECVSDITWHELVELEPKLRELLWTARQACVCCRCWSDVDRLFSPIRNTLAELVGFAGKNHGHPVLGGSGAYQVAYRKLYDAVAGLLPARVAGAEEAPEKQRGQTVTETGPTESTTTATATA
jgi:hypothetical protein